MTINDRMSARLLGQLTNRVDRQVTQVAQDAENRPTIRATGGRFTRPGGQPLDPKVDQSSVGTRNGLPILRDNQRLYTQPRQTPVDPVAVQDPGIEEIDVTIVQPIAGRNYTLIFNNRYRVQLLEVYSNNTALLFNHDIPGTLEVGQTLTVTVQAISAGIDTFFTIETRRL